MTKNIKVKKIIAGGGLIILGALLMVSSACASGEDEDVYARGVQCIKSGKYDDAISEFRKALQLNPKLIGAYYSLGVAFDGKGDIEEAIKYYTKIIQLYPHYEGYTNIVPEYDAYINRGIDYAQQKELNKAIDDFTFAIKVSPFSYEAYQARGTVYIEKGNFDDAITDFDSAITCKSDVPASVYYNRGLAYMNKNKSNEALADYSKAIEIDPKYGEAYYNRANLYFYKKDYDKSWQDLNKAEELGIEPRPEFLESLERASGRESRSRRVSPSGKPVGSGPDFTQERKMGFDAKQAMVMCNLGVEFYNKASEIYNRQKAMTDDAKKYLDSAINLYDKASLIAGQNNYDVSYIYYQWARALLLKEDYVGSWEKVKLSRRHSKKVVEPEFIEELSGFMKEPEEEKSPEAKLVESKGYYNKAAAYISNKQYDDAISNYTKAIEINPGYSDAYYMRGVVYGMKELHDEAIADLTKAIELSPENAHTYYNRGYGYSKKGMYNEAIADYNKAITLTSYEPSYYFYKAEACDKAGLFEQAKEAYKKFLKIAPYEREAEIKHAKERVKQLDKLAPS